MVFVNELPNTYKDDGLGIEDDGLGIEDDGLGIEDDGLGIEDNGKKKVVILAKARI